MLPSNHFTRTGILFMLLILVLAPALSSSQIFVDIQVSPNVLNLQNKGQVVTVHTDLSYGSVSATTVTLNGVVISHWKADNQGNFVAKFLIETIKNLPLNIGELNTLTLEGSTYNGETFIGSYDVMVINVNPSGNGNGK
ncbi:MAG: hypothetical protein IH597_01850 [Bacteroidales bacterium]|nr:hypothetical protein [Bacteroidales bacterium]